MKVLLLVHQDLVPPEVEDPSIVDWDNTPWVTEYQVKQALLTAGHNVHVLGVYENLQIITDTISEFKPSIVFNLLEEFNGEATLDQNVVSHLELLGIPYTGCNPKGLILARDKALSKKILAFHKIKSAEFQVFPLNTPQTKVKIDSFPVIVKCLNEEASLGLSQASIVKNDEKLKERVKFIHENFKTDAIAEEFIQGQEFFVGVMGNYRLQALPVWQLKFNKDVDPENQWYTTNAKFNESYRKRNGIQTGPAEISEAQAALLQKISKKAYQILGLSGYARMDLRVSENEDIYILEANPNPDISEFEDFAMSAKSIGISYIELINKIISMGKQWSPHNN
ncbi:MAG: ATP-grasp domain-containing protein [Bdellovibrionaceae bacterium]|nr:ATP-grasp domain-containing protein [Pseudobdellovibrionaceae bacterium]